MGTSWAVKLAGAPEQGLGRLRQVIEARLDCVVCEMSTWEPASDISLFNAAPAGTWRALPAGFRHVLACALSVAAETGGAFDPTVGRAVELWGFGPLPAPARHQGQDDVDRARASIGFREVRLEAGRALQPGGVALDLSGIAKGFAVDAVCEALVSAGVGHALVEIGGELRGLGVKPDGAPWWAALERPPGAAALPETVVALHGLAVATSGDYRRVVAIDGGTASHTIDPRSGAPVRHDLASVSVLDRSCMRADALATALMVLGPEGGVRLAAEAGLAALFVRRGRGGFSELASPALLALAG